jgi:hypothetical protein
MADGKSSDELAHTATAPGSDGRGSVPVLGETLGRYRLERALGAGGMGVVHAAFDPDLERRVALKVLRTNTGGEEARHRLLREARAMARLTHPNVVTVHEVGTAGGRDYVAMELIEGEPLAEWLRAAPRKQSEIVAAFAAAGRGLAAAHAAGLVHRDFKPHNVLRRSDGRICVTDFGLARGVEVTGLESTLRMPAMKDPPTTSLSGLTATGSVMGTPAYMAPEQWSGGTVGPAADQFAFCVALWEALTGERPFRGTTVEELKGEVLRGPAALDDSELPRRLRKVLRRGLEPDAKQRWPDMDALLAALARAEQRPKIVRGVAATAVIGAIAVLALRGRSGNDCAAPMLDPAGVWSVDRAAALTKADQAPSVEALAGDFAKWQQVRSRACHGDAAARPVRLACLDGVLATLAIDARALETVKHAPHAEIGELLVDPAVCDAPRPPRLVPVITPERVDATAAYLEITASEVQPKPEQGDAIVARAAQEPCAAVLAHIIASRARRTTVDRRRELEEADGAAQRCGDDRLSAHVAFERAATAIDNDEPDVTSKVERADAAVGTVLQPDLRAAFDQMRAVVAVRAGHLDEAITQLESARDGYAARGRVRAKLRAELLIENLLTIRGHADDLARLAAQLAEWRQEAVTRLGESDPVVRDIDEATASWQFANGDVAGSHAKRLALAHQLPLDHPVHASGRVVDENGAPVAGAAITAGPSIEADSVGIMPETAARTTTSGSDGTFELPEAAADGIIVAQVGNRRSLPAHINDGLTLALAPTSRLEGHIDLRGEPATNVVLVVRDPSMTFAQLAILAPVHRDGSFSIDGVARGKMILHAELRRVGTALLAGKELTITDPVMRDIELAVPGSKRAVNIVVRSTVGIPLTHAVALVMPGKVASTNAADLQKSFQDLQQREATRIEGEHAPKSVLAIAKPGDVYATLHDVPEGTVSACAIGEPIENDDPDLQHKLASHLDKIEVRCVQLGEHDETVLIEVPPWPRFD